MKLERLSISALSADPANARRHSEPNLEAIKASLRRFGQQKPIVIDKKSVVRAGNGLLEAAKALGWTEIDVVRTDLKGSEATAYAIADNRTAELAEWDLAILGAQLEALQTDGFGLQELGGFCAAFCAGIKAATRPGAALYMAMSAQEWPVIDAALRHAGFHWSSTIIWAKDSLVLGRGDYHRQYEPLWYGWQEGRARLHPVEDRKQSDVWNIPRPRRSDEHPTMKPVELIARSLENSTARGNLVFEPFSGSGSTLVACEQTGRACRAIELEPKYVQVAIERWQAFTGASARKAA